MKEFMLTDLFCSGDLVHKMLAKSVRLCSGGATFTS